MSSGKVLSSFRPTRRVWFGLTTVERLTAWTKSSAVWLSVVGVTVVWATDWKPIMAKIPFIKTRYPPPATDNNED